MTNKATTSKRRFDGQVVLVTGSSRGLGFAIAQRFASEGATLVLNATSHISNQNLERVQRLSPHSTFKPFDVCDWKQVCAAVEEILARYRRIDVLVNNAGILAQGTIVNTAIEEFTQVTETNLRGPFLCAKAVATSMIQRRSGAIVNVSSRAYLGNPYQAAYASSKGGVISLTRSLALELARYGIRVNAVAPGFIETAMTRGLPKKVKSAIARARPIRRRGKPEDVAAAVAFLASDIDAGFITGETLHVDGGRSIGSLKF